ncbi:ATP-binding protein [Thorsellia kenyensis]|uniref:histidine kinase n=1 Tax=Thorsellia kenyensis TaxID=1549888 RepID=A0ABV6CC41_9GAMM
MSNFSLKFRLICLTILFISVGFIGTGLFLVNIFNQYVQSQVKQELLIHLNQLTASFSIDENNKAVLDKPLSDPRFNNPYSGLYWQINALSEDNSITQKGSEAGAQSINVRTKFIGLNDNPLLRSRSLWEDILLIDDTLISNNADFYLQSGGPPDVSLLILGRMITLEEMPDERFVLSVAINEAIPLASFNTFKQILFVAFVILTLGMMIIAWLIIHLSLKPLNHIQRRLNDITEGKTRRLVGDYPQEIQPLVDSFNDVLDHDTEVLTRARTQAGNLAHSLKTPLTILSQAAENYSTVLNHSHGVNKKQANSHELSPCLILENTKQNITQKVDYEENPLPSLILSQVRAIKQFIDYHLAQTRAAASASIPGQMTPVQDVLMPLVKTLEVLYQDKKIPIELLFPMEKEGILYFQGEKHDLYEILGNVLDNACKWASNKVRVTGYMHKEQLILWIEDDGPGLDKGLRESVLGRGVRVDEHTQGSGIGLFIVQDLCKLYKGTLCLEESELGGLKVILTLPSPKWVKTHDKVSE